MQTDRDLIVVHKSRSPEHLLPPEAEDPQRTFTLVDGDRVGDVLFEAGEYTLEQIVERCNRDSQTYFARLEAATIRLRRKMAPVDAAEIAVSLMKGQRGPVVPQNRHERRKAKALARRGR